MIKRLVLVSGLWSFSCMAVEINMLDIEGLHQSDGNGAYDQLLKMILKKSPEPTNLKLYDPAKAAEMFESCNNCCISPANKSENFYSWKGETVELAAFNYAKIYAFTKSGAAPLESLEQLDGKKVGLREGMPYGDAIDNATFEKVMSPTIEVNVSKLSNNEIEAFIAYVPDAYAAFKGLGIGPLPHNKKSPLAIHTDRLVCRGVSPQFIEAYNAEAKNLRKLGVFRMVLKDNLIKAM